MEAYDVIQFGGARSGDLGIWDSGVADRQESRNPVFQISQNAAARASIPVPVTPAPTSPPLPQSDHLSANSGRGMGMAIGRPGGARGGQRV